MRTHSARLVAATLMLVCVSLCVHAQHREPSRDSAVYAAVLDSLFREGYYLIRTPYRPSVDAGSHYTRAGGDTLRSDLRIALDVASREDRPLVSEVLGAWRKATWISADSLEVPQGNGTWAILQAGWLSRVGYSADGRWAAVFFRYNCGALCGSEEIAVLRLGANSQWQVVSVQQSKYY